MARIIFTVINDLTYDQRMHRICNSLAEHGYNVLLVGRELSTSIPLQSKKFRQHRMRLFFTRGKLFYVEYNLRLFFFLLFQKFEVVCGIDLDTIVPCYLVSSLKRKIVVYDAHEIFPEVPEVVSRTGIKTFWKAIEKFTVARISAAYTVSESVAGHFSHHYGKKFTVIRSLPEKKDRPLKTEIDFVNPVLLYQGALNEGRGLEPLIVAMQAIPAKLVIAGEGDLSKELRKQAESMDLDRKITFAGRQTPEELKELTKQSLIGFNLLENKGLNYYYSLANKFFDYVHAGIPQVTMSFPEYRKMNDEFEVALLVDDIKPETIRAAVLKLLNEKDFYFHLRENCLRAREVWNWQKEEHKLLSFYSRLK